MSRSKTVLFSLIALAIVGAIFAYKFRTTQQAPIQEAQITATDFSTSSGSDPWGTAFDSKGNVWLALPGCNPSPVCTSSTPPGKIAVFNPDTSSWVTTYQLPDDFAQPLFLAFDAQGRIWFPMFMDNALGMYNPANNTFQKWSVPTDYSGPWAIAIDHHGQIWFTEHYTNKIASFDPVSHTFKEIATPIANSQPYGITVDADNNVWFTENNPTAALIGEYTAGGKLLEYKIRNNPPKRLTPHLITVAPNGNIWWSEGGVGEIGELQVALAIPGTNQGVTEYTYPLTCGTCGTHTSGISVDSSGLVWFDDSLQGIFGSFPDSGKGTFTIYKTPTPYSHPHDGLRVDAQNRIWFDEESANQLAVATRVNGASSPPS